MKFPRLSHFLALVIILAASLFAFAQASAVYQSQLLGAVVALGVIYALSGHRISARLGAFENTVAAELNLAKIMDTVLEAFVAEILPLRAFANRIVSEPQTLNSLKTAKLEVPYVPVQTNAVRNFDAATGDCYVRGSTSILNRTINIDKRKYLPWGITSWQAATTPLLSEIDFARIFGQQLASEVITDILSVVTAANFPNELAVGAASGFTTDDVYDIRQELNTLKFPKTGRSLILTPDYDTNLLKDNKDADVFGSTDPRWNARIPRIADMEEYGTNAFDDNADVDAGIVAMASAILVAMAPLEPTPAVRSKLVDFQIFTHESSGISLVYKMMADEFCDNELELVECTYGYGVGQEEALLRLEEA